MRTMTLRQCLGAGTLAAALTFMTACSGQFGSASTGPTALGGGGSTAIEIDPCAPTLASRNIIDVPPPPESSCEGRFTGGGFQVNGDVKVTRGFTLHCDAILSNNFEVNWPDGNNFHIDKNPTDVVCSLIANPNPPDAPVNRIDINGTGTLNGAPATVTLVLVDNGEKSGAPQDQAYIAINGVAITGGSVAVPAPIDGGNIQAHFDQPHKN